NETVSNIRERVTDLIFRVQIRVAPADGGPGGGPEESGTPVPQPGGPGPGMATASKADATNAGFAGAARDRQQAMQQQGEASKPQTFRRAEPRVGRNDPCPCGSGKKYKQCHGKGKA